MGTNLKVSMGEIIVLTSGEYSDFGVNEIVVFLKDADLKKLAQEFIVEREGKYGSQYEFASHLIAQEYCAPVKQREIHIGAYGRFSNDFGIKEPA